MDVSIMSTIGCITVCIIVMALGALYERRFDQAAVRIFCILRLVRMMVCIAPLVSAHMIR